MRISMIQWMWWSSLFVFMGCLDAPRGPGARPDVKQSNQVRKKIGIRQIQNSWTYYGTEFGAEDWVGAEGGYKRVQRDPHTGELLWEEAYYYSGRSFVTNKGNHPVEMLTVHYDYLRKRFSVAGVTDDVTIDKMVDNLESGKEQSRQMINQETIRLADTILRKWKRKRL